MGFEPMTTEAVPVFKTGAINQTPPPLRATHRQAALRATQHATANLSDDALARRPRPFPSVDIAEYSS